MSTTDGGTTWQMDILDAFPEEKELKALDFIPSGHGWATGISGLTLKTFFPVNVESNTKDIGIKIFPNPVNSFVHIVSDEPIQEVIFFNELGEKLFESTNINNKEFYLKLSDYKPGLFFISINGNIKKIIKM